MLILPLIISLTLATLLAARYAYLRYLRSIWIETCLMYVRQHSQGTDEFARYAALWPMWQMVLSAHQWDFKAFIKDVSARDAILTHFKAAASVTTS